MYRHASHAAYVVELEAADDLFFAAIAVLDDSVAVLQSEATKQVA
ncbi:hypothetical protein [Nocardia sp. SYP-A9097]|nr:hypothetical protein [Nocardia sp. SYP-A9097]